MELTLKNVISKFDSTYLILNMLPSCVGDKKTVRCGNIHVSRDAVSKNTKVVVKKKYKTGNGDDHSHMCYKERRNSNILLIYIK